MYRDHLDRLRCPAIDDQSYTILYLCTVLCMILFSGPLSIAQARVRLELCLSREESQFP